MENWTGKTMVMCLSVCLLRRMDGMVKLASQDGTPELGATVSASDLL